MSGITPRAPAEQRTGGVRFLAVLALALLGAAPPLEAAFGYRKPLAIDGDQVVGGPHLDFPVLVSIVDADLRTVASGGRVRSAQGFDIEFRAADGVSVLDHETEVYDGATGRLSAWVRFPGTNPAGGPDTRIENPVDTAFYVYYGDASITCARNNPKRVWNAGYRYVYHFNQAGAGALPLDSTAAAVPAVIDPGGQGVHINRGDLGDPLNGYGWDLDSTTPPTPSVPPGPFTTDTNSMVQVQDGTLAANQAFTIESWLWFDWTDTGNWVGLVTKGRESGCNWVGLFKQNTDRPQLGMQNLGGCGSGGNVTHGVAMAAGRWYYGAVSFDPSTSPATRSVFLYEAATTDNATPSTYASIAENSRIGDDSNGHWMDGRVTEVRFSNVARSAAWLRTQARNQACSSATAPWACLAYTGITTPFLAAGVEQALSPTAGTLVNATASSGLALGGLKEAGVSWGDFNGDGCLDAIANTNDASAAPDGQPYRSRLFLQARSDNCTGSFTDVTQCLASGLLAVTAQRSIAWGDLNNDGHLDFARSAIARIEVYLSGGPGTTAGAGCGSGVSWSRFGLAGAPSQTITITGPPALNTEGLGLVDHDADGDLDLFFDTQGASGGELRVALNDGAGSLSVLAAGAAALPAGGPLGGLDYAAFTDVDGDGRVDFAWRSTAGADLYFNQGGTFVAATLAQMPDIVAENANKGGVAFCDLDADGDFDLLWTDAPAAGACDLTSTCQTQVWEQTGIGSRTFASRGGLPGLAAHNVDGVACGDLDHDNRRDVVLTGHTRGFVFHNDGGFAFTEVSPAGFGATGGAKNGEGVALGDYDRDGDLDVLMNEGEGTAQTNELWRNETNDRNYLVVRAMTAGRDAVGATAGLYSCAGALVSGVSEVNGGMGHGSQGPLAMHFGLPTTGDPQGPYQVYEVRVRFVGGAVVRRALRPFQLGCHQEVTISSTDPDDVAACSTTAVRLLSFGATGLDGAVDLRWQTGSEVDNLGFHVHRSASANGPWTRLTSTLIPGQGFSPMGAYR